MVDYQFSLVDEFDKLGCMEYRTFADDVCAMDYAEQLVREPGDHGRVVWLRVTVLDGARIVGVVTHPADRVRT